MNPELAARYVVHPYSHYRGLPVQSVVYNLQLQPGLYVQSR